MLFDLPKLPRLWRWGTGLLLAALVLLGTKFSPCSLAALGILALFALTGNLSDIAFFFVLITPLATVFRPNASAQSYLTYVLLLYALVSILNTLFIRREVDVISVLLSVFFLAAVAGQLLALIGQHRTVQQFGLFAGCVVESTLGIDMVLFAHNVRRTEDGCNLCLRTVL